MSNVSHSLSRSWLRCPVTRFVFSMRLFKLFSLFSLLLGARASTSSSHDPHPLDVRELLDVCAFVNADLEVPNLLGILTILGKIGESN